MQTLDKVLNKDNNGLVFQGSTLTKNRTWKGSTSCISFDPEGIKEQLQETDKPCYIVKVGDRIGATNYGYCPLDNSHPAEIELIIAAPPIFTKSFGAGGLSLNRLEEAIKNIQASLPDGPYAFNLIHSPNDPEIERGAVDLYLKYGVETVEASAFLDLTPNIVYYRAAGLSLNSANKIQINNKVIAKISRREVASKFMQPAPLKMLKELVENGLITELQATLAALVPIADDITVEADSGGHTDNRPLVCVLPSIIALKDEIQAKYSYEKPVRVGVAGGISTPQSALAAFMMGAAYVVTGSINQSCVEAGTSTHTKKLLAQADIADVMMAPAADMFEMGVKLQVLKRGTMFPLKAQKLYEIYRNYNSLEELPSAEKERLEKQVFRKSIEEIWQETVAYQSQSNPHKLSKAAKNSKYKKIRVWGIPILIKPSHGVPVPG